MRTSGLPRLFFNLIFLSLFFGVSSANACVVLENVVAAGVAANAPIGLLYESCSGTLTVFDGASAPPSIRGVFIEASGNDGVDLETDLVSKFNIPAGSISIFNPGTPNEIAFGNLSQTTNVSGTGFNLGAVLPTTLTQQQLDDELTVFFQRAGVTGNIPVAVTSVTAVPESSAFLCLLTIGGLGAAYRRLKGFADCTKEDLKA